MKLRRYGQGFLTGFILLASLQIQAAEKLNVAWSPTVFMPQVDIARERGYFNQSGLDLNVNNFSSGREALEAVTGGQADIAAITEFPLITGILRRQSFVVLADLARYRGTRVIVSTKHTPLNSLSDLSGLKIGTTLGSNTDFALRQSLAAAGVKANVINVAPADLLPALLHGDIQAMVPFAGTEVLAKKALGGAYGDLKLADYQSHFLLVASLHWVQAHPQQARLLVAALQKAHSDLTQDLQSASAVVSKNLNGTLSPKQIISLGQEADFGLQPPTKVAPLLKREGEWIMQQGVIPVRDIRQLDFSTWLKNDPAG